MMQKWEIDQHGTSCASSGDVEVIAITSVARMDMSVNVYQDWIVVYEVRDRTTPHIIAEDNIQRSIGWCVCHQNSLPVD